MTRTLPLAAVVACFERARRLAVARAAGGDDVKETEWRRLVVEEPRRLLAPEGIEALRRRQAARVEAARRRAGSRSVLDLDLVRRRGLVTAFSRELPKGALLHTHLNGAVRPDDFFDMAMEVDPAWLPLRVRRRAPGIPRQECAFLSRYPPWTRFRALSEPDRRRLAALVTLPPGPVDPRRFDSVFGLVSLLEPGPEGSSVGRIARRYLTRCAGHRLLHVELTRTLQPERRTVRLAATGVRTATAATGVSARLVWSFPRGAPPVRLREAARRLAATAPPSEIAAVDLVGTAERPLRPAAAALLAGLAAGGQQRLQLVLHAGWNGDPAEVRDAMVLGAHRLGHALGLAGDPVLLELAAARRLAVEACPTSNLRRAEVTSLTEHPLLTFLRLGLRVSLATDDEGPFETDISREWSALIASTNIVYDEVRTMVINSVATSFWERESRRSALARLETDLRAFEERWRSEAGAAPP